MAPVRQLVWVLRRFPSKSACRCNCFSMSVNAVPVLYRAYRMEVRERNPNLHADDGDPIDDVDCDGGGNGSGGADGGLSATSGTHSVPKPDPSRNFPKPGPIPTGPGSIKNGNNVNRTQSNRPQSPEETAQIEDIKENQYAWHCQVCLSTIEPKLLAPPSSYVELHHNRQPIMHAHHCDQVHTGGARHAGNLLLLCSFHHSEFGDAVSRVEVIQSLHQATEMQLTFSSDDRVLRDVNGNIEKIPLLRTGLEPDTNPPTRCRNTE